MVSICVHWYVAPKAINYYVYWHENATSGFGLHAGKATLKLSRWDTGEATCYFGMLALLKPLELLKVLELFSRGMSRVDARGLRVEGWRLRVEGLWLRVEG